MAKAETAETVRTLVDIPNIGVAIAQDLCSLGLTMPEDVKHMDPLAVYEALRTPMGQRHDPCLLDTFLAAKKFMNGGPRQPWWNFTAERKVLLNKLSRN